MAGAPVTLADFDIASDKNERGEDDKGDYDEDVMCSFDLTHRFSPCFQANCTILDTDQAADHCVLYEVRA